MAETEPTPLDESALVDIERRAHYLDYPDVCRLTTEIRRLRAEVARLSEPIRPQPGVTIDRVGVWTITTAELPRREPMLYRDDSLDDLEFDGDG